MNGIKSQVAKTTKTLAQQAAKQVAQEPLEVIKAGTKQVAGMEKTPAQVTQTPVSQTQPAPQAPNIEALRQQDVARSRQLHEKLEREIKEIREKEQQKKILQAQAQPQPVEPPIKPLQEPAAKRSRRLFSFGPKTAAERKRTRVERVQPPTG